MTASLPRSSLSAGEDNSNPSAHSDQPSNVDDILMTIERDVQGLHQEIMGSLVAFTTFQKQQVANSNSGGSTPRELQANLEATAQHCRASLHGLMEASVARLRQVQQSTGTIRDRLKIGSKYDGDMSSTHGSNQQQGLLPQVMGMSPATSEAKPPAASSMFSMKGNETSQGGSFVTGLRSPDELMSLSNTFGRVVIPEGSPNMTPTDGTMRPGRGNSIVRAQSFSRRRQDGVDVVMFSSDTGSPDVSAAINETYSLGSRGSWRRRSTFAGVQEVRRRSYLPVVELEGMPALNLDDPGDLRSRFSRQSTRHSHVFQTDSNLMMLLDECDIPRIYDINSPEFNLFEEFKSHGEQTFTYVVMNVILKYSFVSSFQFNVRRLHQYVDTVRQFYRNNPFHNALHAADVVQTTHVYLCQRDVKENFTDVELLAVLFAAMIIDLGHLGVSNDFLAKTKHPIARLYNESSPQECMHCALAFCLLDDPDVNFFLESTEWTASKDVDFRFLVSTFVLGSDSTKHAEILSNVDQLLSQGRISDDQVPMMLTAIIHAADMNYSAKPRHIYQEWASRYMAEKFRQGEAERELFEHMRDADSDATYTTEQELVFYEVSKMCDRECIDPVELQLSTVEFVVLPFMTILRQVLPPVWYERLQFNHDWLLGATEMQAPGTGATQNGAPGSTHSTITKLFDESIDDQLNRDDVNREWTDVDPKSEFGFASVLQQWLRNTIEPDATRQASFVTTSFQVPESGNDSITGGQPNTARPMEAGSNPSSFKRSSFNTKTADTPVNTVFSLTSEMLKQTYALFHAYEGVSTEITSAPASPMNQSWSQDRETTRFAKEWVALLRNLEDKSGLRLLEGGKATGEDPEKIIRAIKDQTPPHPRALDALNPNAPVGTTVLLTQIWWAMCTSLNEQYNRRHSLMGQSTEEVTVIPPKLISDTVNAGTLAERRGLGSSTGGGTAPPTPEPRSDAQSNSLASPKGDSSPAPPAQHSPSQAPPTHLRAMMQSTGQQRSESAPQPGTPRTNLDDHSAGAPIYYVLNARRLSSKKQGGRK